MKRHDLLKCFDDDLLDKLFGFSYARTKDSYEAEELCSDIIYALVRAAYREGEIESVYSFIWRVAHNVYADFASKRRKRAEMFYEGDSEEIILHPQTNLMRFLFSVFDGETRIGEIDPTLIQAKALYSV